MKIKKKQLENFGNKIEDSVVIGEKLALYLLVIEERPGVLIMDPDFNDRKKLKQFCREYDLEFHYTGGEGKRGLKDKLLRTDSRMFKGGFFIAREKERFQKLKRSKGRFYGFSDEGVGEFLGYPEDDIKYFSGNVTDGHIEKPTREKAEKLVSNRVIKKDDLKYLELVSYVPRPERENIVRAIETGEERHRKIEDIDQKYGVKTGKNLLREVFRDPLYLS